MVLRLVAVTLLAQLQCFLSITFILFPLISSHLSPISSTRFCLILQFLFWNRSFGLASRFVMLIQYMGIMELHFSKKWDMNINF